MGSKLVDIKEQAKLEMHYDLNLDGMMKENWSHFFMVKHDEAPESPSFSHCETSVK